MVTQHPPPPPQNTILGCLHKHKILWKQNCPPTCCGSELCVPCVRGPDPGVGTVVVAVLPSTVVGGGVPRGRWPEPVIVATGAAGDDWTTELGDALIVIGTLDVTAPPPLLLLLEDGRPRCPPPAPVKLLRPFFPFGPFGGGGSTSTSSLNMAATLAKHTA